MVYKILRYFILVFLMNLLAFALYSEDADKDTSSIVDVKILNNIIIDTEKKEIRIHCKLAITEGILEFFLVDEKGNTYESVFKVKDNKPSELHFALLLLGFEPVPFQTYYELLDKEDGLSELQKKKCLLQCKIYKLNKQNQEYEEMDLSAIIGCREPDKSKEVVWVFTGASFTKDNKYIADYTYTYISIWPMMESVINLFSSAGNPYRGEYGYEIIKDISFSQEDDFILILKGVE